MMMILILSLVILAVGTGATTPPSPLKSSVYDHVNPLIGNGGDTPNTSGGMIPSTGPPFPSVRWVAVTDRNYVSVLPYDASHAAEPGPGGGIAGFQGTRQPAIWMGESGPVGVVPGFVAPDTGVKVGFEERKLRRVDGEVISPAYYKVELEDEDGRRVVVEQSSTSHVGHLRFTFRGDFKDNSALYSVLIEAARPSVITSTPTNVTFPNGKVTISPFSGKESVVEMHGYTDERQDWIITPTSIAPHAEKFKGYFWARISSESPDAVVAEYGIVNNLTLNSGLREGYGSLLSAYVLFSPTGGEGEDTVIDVRVGTSLISESTARSHIEFETPQGSSLEDTARVVRERWVEKLDRITVEGASEPQKEVFYTAVFHSLTYPNEQTESGMYWSGYDGRVHQATESYTGYSIWDTYRAEWAWLILMAPERVPGMINSMLADYKEGGWLPMWKNIVETNIMVGTHADSLIAEAVIKGVVGYDRELAWEAVWKDASVAPKDDWTVQYFDREENVDYEVRAGLFSVYNTPKKGWVADDIHSESASRTLDYAYDDYAAAMLARALGKPDETVDFLLGRAMEAPFSIWNPKTKFMEARNANGSFAGQTAGWTEGDMWAYSFDVVHNIPRLIQERGGNASFVQSLDEHFNGGHNDHTNEPSHHIPYLYALAGAAYKTQERIREIALNNYNNTVNGLSGNEDCGQMSAWYIFSAMGFYPVNPVSGEYVVGSPFHDKITIRLPPVPNVRGERTLTIIAPGAQTKPYVKSLSINGVAVTWPIIHHDQIADGGSVVFEMSDKVEGWGNGLLKEDGINDSPLPHQLLYQEATRQHVEL